MQLIFSHFGEIGISIRFATGFGQRCELCEIEISHLEIIEWPNHEDRTGELCAQRPAIRFNYIQLMTIRGNVEL